MGLEREDDNLYHFNSRPHEEVDGDLVIGEDCEIVFQLTTSRRRGRLLPRQRKQTKHTYFNSRPHEEVDKCSQFTD